MEIKEQSKLKHVKFTTEQVYALFKLFNTNKQIKSLFGSLYSTELGPVKGIDGFHNPESIRSHVTSDKFNAYCVIDCGHVYENFPKGGRSREERLEDGKKAVKTLITEMEKVIKGSNDPLYTSLKVELMNKKLDICYTKVDHGDDGDDHFGMEVFLKIHY